jgi:hypothetical protein
VSHARYKSIKNPSYDLAFSTVADANGLVSDVAIEIRESTSTRKTWYYFDEGSSQRISLISTDNPTAKGWHAVPDGGVRPHGPATYIGMDRLGNISWLSPKSTANAPYFIIIPELADTLRHERVAFNPSAFVLTKCDRR